MTLIMNYFKCLLCQVGLVALFALMVLLAACGGTGGTTAVSIQLAPVSVSKSNATAVYMHYMSWFETPHSSANGQWGSHWTMSNQDPNVMDSTGKRQIASKYYPIIGPYSSGDPDVLDYHTLLMKYAGIDGILVDWYGTSGMPGYASIQSNTEKLWDRIPKTGLKMGIVYEDQTVPIVASIKAETPAQVIAADFAYLEKMMFNSPSYLTINGRPMTLVYGPEQVKTAATWTQALSALTLKPILLGLWSSGFGEGEFSWVENTVSQHLGWLTNFEVNIRPTITNYFSAVYAGFDDFYTQGGWPDCCNWTIPPSIAMLDATLKIATDNQSKFVQLATWNDFGEGTALEPTQEFGFDFLQRIQNFTGVSYGRAELELIHKWYQMRKKYAQNPDVQLQLTQAYYYLVALRVAQAQKILDSMN
jgi:hypothetical protein